VSELHPVPTGARTGRDVLVLVLTGCALGVGYNALQWVSNPSRAVPWMRAERRVVSLAAADTLPKAPPAVVTPPPAQPVPARPQPAKPAATRPATTKTTPQSAPAKPEAEHAAPATPGAAAPAAPTAAPASAAALPEIPDSRSPVEVGTDIVRRLYDGKAALFVDARSAADYAQGHIAGAINLPFDDVFKDPSRARALDAGGRPIVTYCDGGDCDLSRNLAFSLLDAGQHRVLVFTGGIPAWKDAGGAIHTGDAP